MKKLMILLLLMLLFSCEGKEGPMGPTGPKGDKGDAATTDVFVYDFNPTSNPHIEYISEINRMAFEKGDQIIMVYFYHFSGSGWIELPLTQSDILGDIYVHEFIIRNDGIELVT